MSASRSFAVRLRSDALVGAALAWASVVATRTSRAELKRILMIWDSGVCCGDNSDAIL